MADLIQAPAGPRRGPATTAASSFHNLVQRRRRMILWASTAALSFYLLQVILSVFSTLLDGFAFGPFTWGWLYALAQLLVPLAILHFYQARSAALDIDARRIVERSDA